jgi:hypothetical protein
VSGDQRKAGKEAMKIHLLQAQWSRLEFATRCARRAKFLFPLAWPGAPASHAKDIDAAIHGAEQVVKQRAFNPDCFHLGKAAGAVSQAAATIATKNPKVASLVARSAECVAMCAQIAAWDICADAGAQEAVDSAEEAFRVAGAADLICQASLAQMASDFQWISVVPNPPLEPTLVWS